MFYTKEQPLWKRLIAWFLIGLQARTQPKIYGGAKLILQDLYVYIFAALKNFLVHMSAFCL